MVESNIKYEGASKTSISEIIKTAHPKRRKLLYDDKDIKLKYKKRGNEEWLEERIKLAKARKQKEKVMRKRVHCLLNTRKKVLNLYIQALKQSMILLSIIFILLIYILVKT